MANKTYRVTGRYMTGSEVTGYHLVDSNGADLAISRDKAILMTSRGDIENLRIQYSGDDVIIRGKGINLNSLPVYDIKKEQFRGANVPETRASNKPNTVNPLAGYKIIKRILYKTSCVGYVLQDAAGATAKLNRNKTIEFAVKGLVINADAQKYTDSNSGETKLVLRGIGCELKNLPAIIVDQNGNEVDTSKTNQNVTVRATQSRRAGIIYCETNSKKTMFNPGDYIICTPTGGLNVMDSAKAREHMKKSGVTSAICDNYLDNLNNYSVEFLGNAKQKLLAKTVLNWAVVSITR